MSVALAFFRPQAACSGRIAIENLICGAAFVATMLLPCLQIGLRAMGHTGLYGASELLQHLTLAIAMTGAAIASRDDRLLSLARSHSPATGHRTQLWRTGRAVAVAVCAALCLAAAQFVATEIAAPEALTFGIPQWCWQLLLPGGFALMAVRLVRNAGTTPGPRVLVATAAAAMLVLAGTAAAHAWFVPVALCVLVAAAVAGAPVFVALGGAALILFSGDGVPIASVALDHYRLFGHPSLPAIPLFTLAGYLLAEGGTPRRLVRVFDRLFGGLRGGAALATVACCMLFMCFTGASGVTVVALGGLLLPMLIAAGHRERNALALVIGSGLPGILIAPSMPLILYAIVAEVNITEMFLGAALPATVLALLVAVWGVRHAPRLRHRRPFDGRRAWRAVRAAGWELLTPLVAIVSIFSGYATPVEAAALTATYTFVVTVLVRRELGWSTDLPRVMAECGLMVGGILLILGVALGFTNYLVDAQVTDRVLEWVTASIDSRWTFLLALNILLLVVGCLMDVYSAVIIMTPLLVPVALAFGVSPIHLGVIFLANLELGFLTPPVGMNLFFAAYRFDKPMPELCRAVLPLAAVLAAAVLVVTYVPWLSTAVPTLLR